MNRFSQIVVAMLILLIGNAINDESLFAQAVAEPGESARWDFGTEETGSMTLHGNVQRDQAGPRPPEFPDQANDNTAIKLDAGAYLSIPDPGADSEYDFKNGDAITLEAWVNPADVRDGQPLYVIGKGRTNSPKFSRDNQNWALRLMGAGGEARVNFLFASKLSDTDKHWHRWTSKRGFPVATGWHHIAISYRFGEPDSIRGWLNGEPTDGTWDMGGATKQPPVVDDDEVRIGERFQGMLDAVAIHRTILDDKVLKSRFHRVGEERVKQLAAEVMPELGEIPAGRVLYQLSDNMPAGDRWLYESEAYPPESMRWLGDSFLISRIPIQYDAWGIRTGWKSPLLLRIAGDVELPVGQHRVLVRARSLSRLWIDGELVTGTKTVRSRGGNLEPIIPIPEPLTPGARLLPFPQQESFVEYEIPTGQQARPRSMRVVLELLVGGNGDRTESGEVCVALQSNSTGPLFVLSSGSSSPVTLTDAEVEPALRKYEENLARLEDANRREAAASQDAFWEQRHKLARETVEDDTVSTNDARVHPIDQFVSNKILSALNQAKEVDEKTTQHFHENVLPILREQCFRCHGEKEQGGLRLNSREHALSMGDSELAAVVPGDPDASEMIVRIRDHDMPPTDEGLTDQQIATLETWVKEGAVWPNPPIDPESVALAPVIDDAAFLRRVYLDAVGVVPTEEQAREFLANKNPEKRTELIEHLLSDERYADHWISFWMDLLAENPTLLNQSLNSTGPFRWFLYESLRDGKALDRMVTELILMRGSPHEGGSAGFGLAGENDSPMAAKGHILASAFLGIELQCARCHDSPYHSTSQEDLYSLAAMLNRKQLAPPKTSRVPDAFFTGIGRESLIQVTLKPGAQVQPKWPFASFTGVEDGPHIDSLVQSPTDSRERLAVLITSPQNRRFSQVMVNHVWNRLLGAGIVQPANDWEGRTASHPELLEWLADQFILHDYDTRYLIKQIMTSQLYQRKAVGKNRQADAEQRFFNAPNPRRLTAEQVVDSLFVATGSQMETEELTFVHDGAEPMNQRLTLGSPSRAWMFASLNNERDRPSLSMPRAQPIVDVLEAFGWTGTRQQPISERESDPNLLQPGILANGTLSMSLTRAADHSSLAQLAIDTKSPAALVDSLFLRFLSRSPNAQEKAAFVPALTAGFADRIVPADQIERPQALSPLPISTWSNHLVPEANEIQEEWQRRVRLGPAVDPRLQTAWREVYEDAIWSLVNDRDFVWIP
jgi:mono/diheme cytochrome c family protein